MICLPAAMGRMTTGSVLEPMTVATSRGTSTPARMYCPVASRPRTWARTGIAPAPAISLFTVPSCVPTGAAMSDAQAVVERCRASIAKRTEPVVTGTPPLPLSIVAVSDRDGLTPGLPLLIVSDSRPRWSAACAATGSTSIAAAARPVRHRRGCLGARITVFLLHVLTVSRWTISPARGLLAACWIF